MKHTEMRTGLSAEVLLGEVLNKMKLHVHYKIKKLHSIYRNDNKRFCNSYKYFFPRNNVNCI